MFLILAGSGAEALTGADKVFGAVCVRVGTGGIGGAGSADAGRLLNPDIKIATEMNALAVRHILMSFSWLDGAKIGGARILKNNIVIASTSTHLDRVRTHSVGVVERLAHVVLPAGNTLIVGSGAVFLLVT